MFNFNRNKFGDQVQCRGQRDYIFQTVNYD